MFNEENTAKVCSDSSRFSVEASKYLESLVLSLHSSRNFNSFHARILQDSLQEQCIVSQDLARYFQEINIFFHFRMYQNIQYQYQYISMLEINI